MGNCVINLVCFLSAAGLGQAVIEDHSPLRDKAKHFQQDLLDKHWLEGLYVSIVPATPSGTKLSHTVDGTGNVIHAGVWTGRYLAGVGYQYAVTEDPFVRKHGGEILRALRILQEVTGKPGLLARGYVKGHGPVRGWERNGSDSREWHQGQGDYANYRWYGDVSVDNFNAVLYGYAVYFDLAADDEQKRFIAHDVERLMTHLLENHCRIIDVDGEVTRWGHVGVDPNPARQQYYNQLYERRLKFYGVESADQMPLRSQLMLLPDLLIAHRITGEQKYLDFYRRAADRFKDNPSRSRFTDLDLLRRLSFTNHSSEGQAYEALYNLIRYERDPDLLGRYRGWVRDLWEVNWMEGNSLFTYMTLAMLPEYRAPTSPGSRSTPTGVVHSAESLRLAQETLRRYPVDRVLRPVMNSISEGIELNPHAGRRGHQLSAKPLPIDQRPLDNEYVWKGDPYQLDGWLKPTVTAFQCACDDALVGWLVDSGGRLFMTLDGGRNWRNMSAGLMGASVKNIATSSERTFLLWAKTDRGIFVTRDGGMSWREAPDEALAEFEAVDFNLWQELSGTTMFRIDDENALVKSVDGGKTSKTAMNGWRIPLARSVFRTPWGIIASGPGGCYRTRDGDKWEELEPWPENETGAADFIHAYWMGRYYGFLTEEQ